MKEKSLFKISLIGSVLGVIILWLASSQMGLSEKMISQIDDVPEGDEVLVRGVVTRFVEKEKVAFIEVSQEEIKDVTVVLFKDADPIDLSEGDYVEVEGFSFAVSEIGTVTGYGFSPNLTHW